VRALAHVHERPRRALLLVALAAFLTFLLAPRMYTAVAGPSDRRWPDGVVNVYDTSGMTGTMLVAAERWTRSGAKVDIRVVHDERAADVIVRRDDARLLELCGRDCLGYSTSIGRPGDGTSEIVMRSSLGGTPRPLSVWVAAHELGHVLGLHHRDGHDCSVMSPRAFDTRCAPSLAASAPTQSELRCVPAPADVDVAASMYGGAAALRDPRCR